MLLPWAYAWQSAPRVLSPFYDYTLMNLLSKILFPKKALQGHYLD